jgi:hypothetical protein
MTHHLETLQRVIFWVLVVYGTLVVPLCPILLRDAFQEVGKGRHGMVGTTVYVRPNLPEKG